MADGVFKGIQEFVLKGIQEFVLKGIQEFVLKGIQEFVLKDIQEFVPYVSYFLTHLGEIRNMGSLSNMAGHLLFWYKSAQRELYFT